MGDKQRDWQIVGEITNVANISTPGPPYTSSPMSPWRSWKRKADSCTCCRGAVVMLLYASPSASEVEASNAVSARVSWAMAVPAGAAAGTELVGALPVGEGLLRAARFTTLL